MFRSEQLKMTKELESFINEIKLKYNKKIQIIVSNTDNEHISSIKDYTNIWNDEIEALASAKTTYKLNVLEDLIIDTMHTYDPDLYYIESFNNISTRKKDILIWVQAFSYIARKMGFSATRIGKYIKRNHATVLNSSKVIDGYLSTGDIEFKLIYKQILKSIKKYVGIISTNPSAEDDSRSVLNSLRDKKESIITIEQCT